MLLYGLEWGYILHQTTGSWVEETQQQKKVLEPQNYVKFHLVKKTGASVIGPAPVLPYMARKTMIGSPLSPGTPAAGVGIVG